MTYSLAYLQQGNLLLSRTYAALRNDSSRGLFLGIYHKVHFEDLIDFVQFTTNISSLTQDWYQFGSVDSAYEYYYPAEPSPAPLKGYTESTGSLRQWIVSLGVQADATIIPQTLAGRFFWIGDVEEFGLIGENDEFYFEAFLADNFG